MNGPRIIVNDRVAVTATRPLHDGFKREDDPRLRIWLEIDGVGYPLQRVTPESLHERMGHFALALGGAPPPPSTPPTED